MDLDVNALIQDHNGTQVHPQAVVALKQLFPGLQNNTILESIFLSIDLKEFNVVATRENVIRPQFWERVKKRLEQGWVGFFPRPNTTAVGLNRPARRPWILTSREQFSWVFDSDKECFIGEVRFPIHTHINNDAPIHIEQDDFCECMASSFK